MKSAIIVIALLAGASMCDQTYTEFVAWMREHGKVYASAAEHVERYTNYRNNVELVKTLNEHSSGAHFALNKFADMSVAEFTATYLHPFLAKKVNNNNNEVNVNVNVNDYPESLDWREKGAVGPVKNQQSCGSCWAFSVNANLEGAYFVAKGERPTLSEQQLVDCDHTCMTIGGELCCNDGCNGGLPIVSFTYVARYGMMTSADYPYTGRAGECKYDASKATYKFSSSKEIAANEDAIVAALNTYGPVSVGVDATYWSFYSSGIYDTLCSTTALNHGVAIVGYAPGYWIIRNSWGSTWGEKGYMRLVRGKNKCGIDTSVTTIIV